MIYLIVNTSGEYSDWQMTNLFALTSREKLEVKLAELKDLQKRTIKARLELHPVMQVFYQKPRSKYNLLNKFLKEEIEFQNKALEAILPKYNISRKEYDEAYFGDLFIQEIEEP